MKLIKTLLKIVAYSLVFLTILFSSGAMLCKYFEISENSFIQVFGYLSFYWIITISIVTIILLIVTGKRRISLYYFLLMFVFFILLNDFSFSWLRRKGSSVSGTVTSFKVAAYNVKYYSYGIEKISKYARESDIDILLLSESVLTTENLEWLRENAGTFTVYTDGGHDLALLSRYPVTDYKVIELPTYIASLSGPNDPDKLKDSGIHRSFVHAVVNVNGTQVNLLSLRLTAGRPKDKSLAEAIKWGKYLLSAQNQEVSVFLNYINSLKGPVIFGGDLNCPPNAAIIHRIRKYVADSYLDDNYVGSFTFKASMPTARLDYIFHSPDLVVRNSKVINPKLSDHFLIKSEFLIGKNQVNNN